MHYRVLLKALKTEPFQPFDVVMSNGDRYRVDHPENLLISRDSAIIPIYVRNSSREIADDYVNASYLHIAALETVNASKSKK
jgi:hypothetical protein